MSKGMKKVKEVTVDLHEGLEKLLLQDERVTLFCLNYIYTGKLAGVNGDCVLLENAAIVYETGPLCDGQWKDAQPLPNAVYVMKSAIESFMVLK